MLAAGVVALYDLRVVFGHRRTVHIVGDGGIGDAHLVLIGLALEQPRGWSLGNDIFRRAEIGQQLVYL